MVNKEKTESLPSYRHELKTSLIYQRIIGDSKKKAYRHEYFTVTRLK